MQGIKKSRIRARLIMLCKILALVAVLVLIYGKVANSHNFRDQLMASLYRLFDNSLSKSLLLLAIFLMPVNWILEALKWKKLSQPIVNLSLKKAIIGVLSGLSMGFVTPHGIGDYAGRIWHVEGKDRGRLIGSVWLGKVVQMAMTTIFGVFGIWIYFQNHSFEKISAKPLLMFAAGLLLIGLIVFIFLYFSNFRHKIRRAFNYYFGIIIRYHSTSVLQVIWYSFLRYVTFSFQFFLIIIALGIDMPVKFIVAGIGWVFFMKSIIPSFNFLSDLGIREYSALTFFENFAADQASVIGASLVIWMINILIPVLVGLIFIIKIRTNRL